MKGAQVDCKISLKSAGLYEFFGWFCVVLLGGSSLLENALTLIACLGKNSWAHHFPMNISRLVTHMKHLYACLSEIIFICLHSANENSSADL